MPRNSFSFGPGHQRKTCLAFLASFPNHWSWTFFREYWYTRFMRYCRSQSTWLIFQVPNMANTSHDFVVTTKVFFDCFGLRRRLHNHQIFSWLKLLFFFVTNAYPSVLYGQLIEFDILRKMSTRNFSYRKITIRISIHQECPGLRWQALHLLLN